ncbi:MAG: DUF3536 domain-containing protein [Pseudomonadota bacterium]
MGEFGANYVVIHGHFYQPPRENPWIEEIELEESARPYHDWNKRIVAECYKPNAAARIVDSRGMILDIVNNYGLISFDFGPTIMSWLHRNHPAVYQRILAGDQLALERCGRGNAIAGAYNHPILPLCNDRDLETEIVWGKEDFQYRFRRPPEAMWLPETAVNTRVLAALARHGMRFCILGPGQAAAARPLEGGAWQDVSTGNIDTTQPYRCYVPAMGGTEPPYLDVFFYDGLVSQAVGFEDVLSDAGRLIERLAAARPPGPRRIHSVAVDGETFGHHKPKGYMAVAYALKNAAPRAGLRVTNFAAFLDHCPPRFEVRLKDGPEGQGTSWSCSHGVARWMRDCGCTTGSQPGWNQGWRTPLRKALDFVRDRLAPFYQEEAGKLLADPWQARNAYIQVVLDRDPRTLAGFLAAHGLPGLTGAGRIRAVKLLEMQRHCLLMYTSCGWFFADVSGLEPVQVLRYAARALELAAEMGRDIQEGFLEILKEAKSNITEMGDGGRVFERLVLPGRITPERVVNHFAIASIFSNEMTHLEDIFHYRVRVLDYDRHQRGAIVLATGVVELTSGVMPEPHRYAFAMTFLGGYFFRTGVTETTENSADAFKQRLFECLDERPGEVIQLVEEVFAGHFYSLRDVFKEQKKRILEALVAKEIEEYHVAFDHVFETTRDAMEEMIREGLSLPEEFQVAAEKTLGWRLNAQACRLRAGSPQANKIIESEMRATLEQARLFGLRLNTTRAVPRRGHGGPGGRPRLRPQRGARPGGAEPVAFCRRHQPGDRGGGRPGHAALLPEQALPVACGRGTTRRPWRCPPSGGHAPLPGCRAGTEHGKIRSHAHGG